VFDGKTVLITGGTGSFGRSFVPMMLQKYKPRKLIVFSRDEMKQWEMARALDGHDNLRFFIGDVRDKDRLLRALDGVDFVVHAAATKIVPTAEYNPFECVKTNVLGAMNLIDACIDKRVERVVALSTDKACAPVNLYGASKLASDKLFVAGNAYAGEHGTRFSVVRYGNVMGSRGSVIPFFLSQRSQGVLPVTDPRMTRFMITLEEGVDLVCHAFADMQGGEVYVRKIPSMKVVDLARVIAPEARLEIVGIRPGEKLHEALAYEAEALGPTRCPGVLVLGDGAGEGVDTARMIGRLTAVRRDGDRAAVVEELGRWVPELAERTRSVSGAA
jgi:UDP-N-acetylglucosamine 4,6-dehydratase